MAQQVYVGDVPLWWDELEVWWGGLPVTEVGGIDVDAEAYARAMMQLLPEGAAGPRASEAVLYRTVLALAQELFRVHERATAIVNEADPRTTAELLPEWERDVGLPDPCVEAAQTIAERRQALVGRLVAGGGPTPAFFRQLAAALGVEVTIQEFRSEAQAIAAGIPYTGTSWAHTFRVNVPQSVSIREFRAGSGAAGEPLRTWGNDVLECQIKRFKPAHTAVLFAYAT